MRMGRERVDATTTKPTLAVRTAEDAQVAVRQIKVVLHVNQGTLATLTAPKSQRT